MPRLLRSWWWEALCVLVYGAIVGNQLFMRPITGIADNGDFAKVLEHLHICDPARGQAPYQYVYPVYRVDPECNWDSGVTSSESLVARIIKQIAEWGGRDQFSIQAAGKAHLTVVLAALAILLWSLHVSRPLVRYGLPPLLILIFSDVAYVAYFNSFYTDAASMAFLLLTVSLAVAAALRPRVWLAIGFGVASVLLVMSKSQHALLGPLMGFLAVWFGMRSAKRSAAWWMASAGAAMVSTVVMFILVGIDYKTQALYNMVFLRLTTQTPSPVEMLRELGLPASYEVYVGTHAYSPNAPTADVNWERKFLSQTSFLKLALYYLHHPGTTLGLLRGTLYHDGSGIRPADLANYRKRDGFPPGARAHRFDWWSNLRSWLLRIWPAHVILFYFLMLCGSLACVFRSDLAARWPLHPIVLGLSLGGVVEFSCSALLDCIENARHLFLFHVITEMLIVCAFAAALSMVERLPRGVYQG